MGYELLLNQLQLGATAFLMNLLGGVLAFCILVVIMLVGLFIANLLGMVLRKFMEQIKVEDFLEEHKVHDAFLGFTFTNICVSLLKIYVVVAFLGIAAEIAGIQMLYSLAMDATGYMPLLVQGIVILVVALLAGDYIGDRIKTSKKVPFANGLALLVDVFIAYNALVIAMPLLLPAADPSLLVWSFLVLLAAFGIALGIGSAIAIGLGMKDTVADVAKKHKEKINRLF
ncbi:Uncharacterised protein [uncultured archaeon]|nr:Uncharacterised protein [uncultured archaeon]